MIIPGCAGAQTIARNHMQGVTPEKFDFVGSRADHSPMRLDLEEGAFLLKKEVFIVNTVMNEHVRPAAFFAATPFRPTGQP